MGSRPDVPGYLGQVVNDAGVAVGTCFQIQPGVLATAWHVLNDIGAGTVGADVAVAALAGDTSVPATVHAVDEAHDLAVLTCDMPLPGSVPGLVASSSVQPATKVTVTGVSQFPNATPFRYTSVVGVWQGGALRVDDVALGQVTATGLAKGMSGGPVRRIDDGRVVGLVSARYNSATIWLQGTVWVARVEDLLPLLAGVAEVQLTDAGPRGAPLDVTLSVSDTTVRLLGPGVDVQAAHGGIRPGLANALHDVRRERARQGRLPVRADTTTRQTASGIVSLRRAGELMAASFLPLAISEKLGGLLRRAEQTTVAVRLAVDAPRFTALPWEALPDPVTGEPLALHQLVSMFRVGVTHGPTALPGPLRIVVAIASPVDGGPVLDYEAELSAVLDAVQTARQVAADVRIVPFATTQAIREALDGGGVHVLHLSAHGAPGMLVLEDQDGRARQVDAQTLLAEAVPPGAMPPVIALAACYTDVAGQEQQASFAAGLAACGAAAVIGTQTSVTDHYATRFFARVYAQLAGAAAPDVIAAVAEARRAVQRDLARSTQPIDQALAQLDEWSVVTVLAGGPQVPVIGPATTQRGPSPSSSAASWTMVSHDASGLLARPVGQFVGRRDEQRRLPLLLQQHRFAGVVLHGIGGVGKTTLAAEMVRRVRQRSAGWRVVTCTGPLSVDGILVEIAQMLRRDLLRRQVFDGPQAVAVQVLARMDLPWRDRLLLLREDVLNTMPVLLVLDNFEDNLVPRPDGTGWQITDPALADLLTAWVASSGGSRLLVTSRYPFALSTEADDRLHRHHVGPMTFAETRKLVWSLPNLDRYAIDVQALERIWRVVGGHPRSLEYLDALLAAGAGRFPDITRRLDAAVRAKLGARQAAGWLARGRTLDAALADVVILAADDVLLDEHLTRLAPHPGAIQLLAGISVYREPVDITALYFQVGSPDDTARFEPDRAAIQRHIMELLDRYGLTIRELSTATSETGPLARADREQLIELITASQQPPAPPIRPPNNLEDLLDQLLHGSLIARTEHGRVVMHRWTATELHRHWRDDSRQQPSLVDEAHRAAAAYWQWRVDVWPQDRVADIHDLEEARHHLLVAGDIDPANSVTEAICMQLDTWGAWDRETSLIHDTLRWLPSDHVRRPAYYHELGILAQLRGDYAEAERRYQQSLTIFERLGDQAGLARGYHQLGMLAQLRGDYAEAERRYQQSLTIKEQLGNQAGLAGSYHQLGRLAQLRGDYAEAERRYQQSLTISEQ
ncbi:tetratricopeptide repeat protein, partial [Dactylosporangium sp. NPDC048998]|uniref:tetratricopeptide repeat protein n=1 Tax=Dactylosporangium sp. NPDC048998 TaxID=3363976 RepID=UPI00371BEB08